MRISQGTVSVLVGCHSQVHTLLVVLAWKKVHGRWPKLWELGCIALHDIGHLGRNYLDNEEEKEQHWILGAELARVLFGEKGYDLVAGHSKASFYPRSDLYLPDMHSWGLAPKWWLMWQCIVEPKLRCGKPIREHVEDFQAWVEENLNSDDVKETHNAFLKLSKKGGSNISNKGG